MKYFQSCIILIVFSTLSAVAQTTEVTAKPLTDEDIRLLRADVQTVRDSVITHTMQFSQAEAESFWPIYREYARQQHAVADKRLAIITDYAQHLDKMNDEKAKSLTEQFFNVDDEEQALRKTYFPKFSRALTPKRAAKFFQVDNRLTMMVDVQLASEVPLIP